MNNLVRIREKLRKAERLHKAQIFATENGRICNYNPNKFRERLKQAKAELSKT
tara:strand:+ start:9993 stop:10151 length:159 start_codon:yes stop_codon:yes gene_type:complete